MVFMFLLSLSPSKAAPPSLLTRAVLGGLIWKDRQLFSVDRGFFWTAKLSTLAWPAKPNQNQGTSRSDVPHFVDCRNYLNHILMYLSLSLSPPCQPLWHIRTGADAQPGPYGKHLHPPLFVPLRYMPPSGLSQRGFNLLGKRYTKSILFDLLSHGLRDLATQFFTCVFTSDRHLAPQAVLERPHSTAVLPTKHESCGMLYNFAKNVCRGHT